MKEKAWVRTARACKVFAQAFLNSTPWKVFAQAFFKKLVASRRRNGGRSPQRAKPS
jgi:hypothetical protein